jgi:hypothetical protein
LEIREPNARRVAEDAGERGLHVLLELRLCLVVGARVHVAVGGEVPIGMAELEGDLALAQLDGDPLAEHVLVRVEVTLLCVEEADAAMRLHGVEATAGLDVETVDHVVDVGPERGRRPTHVRVVAGEALGQQHHLVLA